MQKVSRAAAATLCACASAVALAAPAPKPEASYPTRPVRLIIPYPPAGSTDFVGREVANGLSQAFGQSVVIDNRPGGGTLLGLSLGAKAPADGYTVTFGTSAGLAVNPALGVKMPYDPLRDFAPIGLMVYIPYLLVVNADVKARNVKELVELAKAQPGKLNFASPGVGTPNHLGIELLNILAGVKFTHVPYKGGALAVNDLVAGRVHILFSGLPQVSGMLKAGRLRAIAVGTTKPTRVAPDLPPVAEAFPGFDCNTWYGLLVPSGTPQPIIEKFGGELHRILTNPTVVQRLLDQGVEATPGSAATFRELIVAETARWRKVIKSAGITAEGAQ
ncbi:MAG TPA: tripartite tricarboxylate transporter substrate binding protein [Burkholderiales bacterium]|nr:tripartite tricarboxylate transporter substrate binding protein [Burkholderiales bacterium]